MEEKLKQFTTQLTKLAAENDILFVCFSTLPEATQKDELIKWAHTGNFEGPRAISLATKAFVKLIGISYKSGDCTEEGVNEILQLCFFEMKRIFNTEIKGDVEPTSPE